VAPSHETWNLLDHFFSSQRPLFSLSTRVWNPPVDVSETADHVFIRMEIAGVQPSDLSVTAERGFLTIRGRRCDHPPAEHKKFHLMEIRYGVFERVFRLPHDIIEDEIHASYHDGFLDIEIQKGMGTGKTIRITVREK